MEEQYYFKTLEMQKGYFNRYAHLYEDPTGKPIYNPIDSKAFKEEDAQQYIPKENVPQQEEIINEGENTIMQKPPAISREGIEKVEEEPVMKTFHRNFEAQQEQ